MSDKRKGYPALIAAALIVLALLGLRFGIAEFSSKALVDTSPIEPVPLSQADSMLIDSLGRKTGRKLKKKDAVKASKTKHTVRQRSFLDEDIPAE